MLSLLQLIVCKFSIQQHYNNLLCYICLPMEPIHSWNQGIAGQGYLINIEDVDWIIPQCFPGHTWITYQQPITVKSKPQIGEPSHVKLRIKFLSFHQKSHLAFGFLKVFFNFQIHSNQRYSTKQPNWNWIHINNLFFAASLVFVLLIASITGSTEVSIYANNKLLLFLLL